MTRFIFKVIIVYLIIIPFIISEIYAQNDDPDILKIKIIEEEKKDNPFEFFQHPLVLLLVGSVISGLLIPFFTKSWQNHQKSLDIKNDLVTEISKTVTTMMINVQYFLENSKIRSDEEMEETQQEYNNDYKKWSIAENIIASRLEAYFPTQNIFQQWKNYTTIINYIYSLSTTDEQLKRQEKIIEVREYLEKQKSETAINQINWDMLENRTKYINEEGEFKDEYLDNWWELKKSIVNAENSIIQDIIKKPIQGFGKK